MRPVRSSMTVASPPRARVRQMTRLLGDPRTSTGGSAAAGDRRERRVQLSARGDAELGEDAVQVGADRAVREKQALADLAVREAVRGKLGDLQLLRRQLVASLGHPAMAAFP